MRYALFALALTLSASVAAARPFSFVAYGDTAYMLPRDLPRVEALIDSINREEPAFAIHVGDFKGYTSCSDAAYEQQKRLFQRHRHALVLTLGDNDWTDCGVDSAGSFDPIERLAALRRIFFSGDRSLGGRTLPLVRQSAAFPENALWLHEKVVFATIHVVGPNNGLVMDKAMAEEAIERSGAGEQWVRHSFRLARESKAPALVLAFQLDPWGAGAPDYEGGPVEWLVRTIREEAASFSGQVLLLTGDGHRLTIDTPYRRADITARSKSTWIRRARKYSGSGSSCRRTKRSGPGPDFRFRPRRGTRPAQGSPETSSS